MGAALLMLVLVSTALAADCPDRLARLDLIEAAEDALVEADLATADARREELEAALACGPIVERDLLGRMWLVEAAFLLLSGDEEAAIPAWQAAGRVAPGSWNDAYGDVLRDAYEAATAETPVSSTLRLEPPLFRWIGAVDGVVTTFPATLPVGQHLVQVGPDLDHVEFAKVVVVYEGSPTVVETGISEPSNFVAPVPTTAPKPLKERKEPRPVALAALYVGVGAGGSRGPEATLGEVVEPALKVVAPVETGLVLRPGRSFVRAATSISPMLNGSWVHEDAFGPASTPVALGGTLAAGLAARQGDVGLLVGWSWPDRVPARVLLAGRLPQFPAQLEARIGLNVALGGPPEPAADVVVAITPGLLRKLGL